MMGKAWLGKWFTYGAAGFRDRWFHCISIQEGGRSGRNQNQARTHNAHSLGTDLIHQGLPLMLPQSSECGQCYPGTRYSNMSLQGNVSHSTTNICPSMSQPPANCPHSMWVLLYCTSSLSIIFHPPSWQEEGERSGCCP